MSSSHTLAPHLCTQKQSGLFLNQGSPLDQQGAGQCLTCTGLVFDEWTLIPRQRLLERLGEVEETPADDDVVVEGHEEADLNTKSIQLVSANNLSGNSPIITR